MKADPRFNGRYVEGAGGTKLFVEEIGDPGRPSIVWIADFISSHVAHAKRIDYDRCGHAPFVEGADQFNRDVAAFMETMS